MKKPKRSVRGKNAATDKRAYFLADPADKPTDDVEADVENESRELEGTDELEAKKDKKQAPALSEAKRAELVKRFQDEYEAGFNKDRDNQDEAYRDLRLVGDDKTEHWDAVALQERTDEGRPGLIVNQTPQFVRQVTGDIRQLKPAIRVTPVDDAASKEVASKVLPGMIRYIEQRSKAANIYFAAADMQAACGIGAWRVTHEYATSRTFNQEIRIEPIPDAVAIVWDPDAVLPDRSDAQYCFVPVDMARRKFKRKYKDASPDPLAPQTLPCFTSWFSDDHVRVAEWFYIDPEKKRLAVYPDGKMDDVTDDQEAEELGRAAGAQIEERDGHCVYRALVTANEIIEGPEKWPGPDIPIIPLLGEEVQIGRATVRRGVVRPLRDVQRVYNYAISTKTELIALQPKSPWIGTDAQFEKYQDEWETANQRNHPYLRYTHVNGVPPPNRVAPATPTQSLDGLLVEMQGAMNATTGIYPAALGAKSNETSGVAIRARQNEGDTGTYVYVSNFASAIQRTGQVIVNMIPQIYDTRRTIQITGEDGKIDQLPINQPQLNAEGSGPGLALNDVTVGAYQVAVEMGPSYSTKREEVREGMTEALRTLGPEGAQLFLDLFFKAQDWPLADKIAERAKELLPPQIRMKEAMEAGEPPPPPPPPPPPTPEQQKQMELEQQKAQEQQQANIELARKNEIEDRKAQLETARLDHERMTLPAIAELQDQLRAEKAKTMGLEAQLRQRDAADQGNALEVQQSNAELARKNDLEDRKAQLEGAKLDHERSTLPMIAELQDQLRAEKAKNLGLTARLEQGSAASEDSAREATQRNIELARQNEIDDRKTQLESAKLDHERTMLPALADLQNQLRDLQDQLRTAQAHKERLEHEKGLDDVTHRVDLHELKAKFLQLQEAVNAHKQETDDQVAEMTQQNIEQARANQLAEDNHALERRKIDLEHQKLTKGEQDDSEAAAAAHEEQVQSNIEQARANELGEKQHGVALKELDFKERQGQRDEERSKREHELAMNPPPAPEPAAKEPQSKADAAQTAAIADLKANVSELVENFKDLVEMVSALTDRVDAVQSAPPPAEPTEQPPPGGAQEPQVGELDVSSIPPGELPPAEPENPAMRQPPKQPS